MEEIKSKNPVGRPSDYTKEIADKVCEELSLGNSLRKITLMDGMPSIATVFKWMREHEEFLKQYARAKEESADAMNEELMELGDMAISLAQTVDSKVAGAVVQGVKLKADNMKWTMSKMKPKKYGEKMDLTTGGDKLNVNTDPKSVALAQEYEQKLKENL